MQNSFPVKIITIISDLTNLLIIIIIIIGKFAATFLWTAV